MTCGQPWRWLRNHPMFSAGYLAAAELWWPVDWLADSGILGEMKSRIRFFEQ